MKIIRNTLLILASLVVIVGMLYRYTTTTFLDLSDYDHLYVTPAQNIPSDGVTVQFAGVSTMLISDQNSKILIDGYFTRSSVWELYQSQTQPTMQPDLDDIDYAMQKLESDGLDALFTVHSHFDHAMDAPEVARRTGARLYGSLSTANIARGWDLPESQISIFQDQQPISIGHFIVTPILSNHYEFPDPELREKALGGNQVIDQPLVPPVKLLDYKMGGHYTLHITHPKGSMVIQGSAGYKNGTLDSLSADVLFMGIAGLGTQSEDYRQAYFGQMLDIIDPQQVFLIHWDGFTAPIDGPLNSECLLLEKYMPSKINVSFDAAIEAVTMRPDMNAHLLPRWKKVVLFE